MGFFWGGGSGLGFLGLREDGGTKEYLVRSLEEVEEAAAAVDRKWRAEDGGRRSFFWRENLPTKILSMFPSPWEMAAICH